MSSNKCNNSNSQTMSYWYLCSRKNVCRNISRSICML